MIQEHFKNQIAQGAKMFFYGLELPEPHTVSIMRHRGSLDTFPTNLEYVRHLTDGMPLFKETP